MKAVFIDRHGGPEVLKYGELPDPVPNPGEIVADVHAASVNAADWKVRTGESLYVQAQFPHVLGRDFSGVVSALGEGVAEFRPGMRYLPCAMSVKRVRTPRRSLSRPTSSPGNPRALAMSRLPLWQFPVSPH